MSNSITFSACNGGLYFAMTRKCYIYYNSELYWDDARAECKKKNGDLATVANQATQDFIKNSFTFSTFVWLGGKRIAGKWTWADGTPFEFDLNIENNVGHDYLMMDSAYRWKDNIKSRGYHYLCQY